MVHYPVQLGRLNREKKPSEKNSRSNGKFSLLGVEFLEQVRGEAMSEARCTTRIQMKTIVEFVGSDIAWPQRDEHWYAFAGCGVLNVGRSIVISKSWRHKDHQASATGIANLIQGSQVRKDGFDN